MKSTTVSTRLSSTISTHTSQALADCLCSYTKLLQQTAQLLLINIVFLVRDDEVIEAVVIVLLLCVGLGLGVVTLIVGARPRLLITLVKFSADSGQF